VAYFLEVDAFTRVLVVG